MLWLGLAPTPALARQSSKPAVGEGPRLLCFYTSGSRKGRVDAEGFVRTDSARGAACSRGDSTGYLIVERAPTVGAAAPPAGGGARGRPVITGSGPPAAATAIGRELAYPGGYLGPVPTLTLFLKPYDTARNQAVCQAFVAMASLPEAEARSRGHQTVIPLRWILDVDEIAPADEQDCGTLVSHYDYFRSGQLLSGFEARAVDRRGAAPDLSGRGPFVVEQIAEPEGIQFVLIDLSATDTSDFGQLSAQLHRAIAEQSEVLTGRPPGAEVRGQLARSLPDPAPNGGGPPRGGLLATVCGFAEGRIARVAEILFSAALPASKAVITPLDSAVKAGCAGQGSGQAPHG